MNTEYSQISNFINAFRSKNSSHSLFVETQFSEVCELVDAEYQLSMTMSPVSGHLISANGNVWCPVPFTLDVLRSRKQHYFESSVSECNLVENKFSIPASEIPSHENAAGQQFCHFLLRLLKDFFKTDDVLLSTRCDRYIRAYSGSAGNKYNEYLLYNLFLTVRIGSSHPVNCLLSYVNELPNIEQLMSEFNLHIQSKSFTGSINGSNGILVGPEQTAKILRACFDKLLMYTTEAMIDEWPSSLSVLDDPARLSLGSPYFDHRGGEPQETTFVTKSGTVSPFSRHSNDENGAGSAVRFEWADTLSFSPTLMGLHSISESEHGLGEWNLLCLDVDYPGNRHLVSGQRICLTLTCQFPGNSFKEPHIIELSGTAVEIIRLFSGFSSSVSFVDKGEYSIISGWSTMRLK